MNSEMNNMNTNLSLAPGGVTRAMTAIRNSRKDRADRNANDAITASRTILFALFFSARASMDNGIFIFFFFKNKMDDPIPDSISETTSNDGSWNWRIKDHKTATKVFGFLCLALFIGIVVLLVFEANPSTSKNQPEIWDNVEGVDVVLFNDPRRPGRVKAIISNVVKYWKDYNYKTDRIVVYTTTEMVVEHDHVTVEHTNVTTPTLLLEHLLHKASPEGSTLDKRVFVFISDNITPINPFDVRDQFTFRKKHKTRWFRRFGAGVSFDSILFGLTGFESTLPLTPFRYSELDNRVVSQGVYNDDEDRFNNILSVWLSEQTNVVYDPRMVQIVHVDGGHDTVTRACLGRGHGQDTTEFQECYFDDVDGDNYTFAAFITTTRESTDVNARIVRHLKHNTE